MSSRQTHVVADGSSRADARPRVRIDRAKLLDRMRYVCPRGHMSWEPTAPSRAGHIWCKTCSRHRDVDPEHWELVDKKTGEVVPWSAVELVDE